MRMMAFPIMFFLCMAGTAGAVRIYEGTIVTPGTLGGQYTVNNTWDFSMVTITNLHANFSALPGQTIYCYDTTTGEQLCSEVQWCSVPAISMDRNIAFANDSAIWYGSPLGMLQGPTLESVWDIGRGKFPVAYLALLLPAGIVVAFWLWRRRKRRHRKAVHGDFPLMDIRG